MKERKYGDIIAQFQFRTYFRENIALSTINLLHRNCKFRWPGSNAKWTSRGVYPVPDPFEVGTLPNRTRFFAGPKIGPCWERINKRPISLDPFWIGSIWNQLCLNMALKGVFDWPYSAIRINGRNSTNHLFWLSLSVEPPPPPPQEKLERPCSD